MRKADRNEPFSVGIHARRRSKLAPGTTLAIMGMGPVGLMAVVGSFKSFGVEKIIVTDLEEVRLGETRRMGATHTINVRNEDALAVIRELTGGVGVDTAWETAGNPKALQSARSLYSLRRGGKLGLWACLHRTRWHSWFHSLRTMKLISMAYSVMPIRIRQELSS